MNLHTASRYVLPAALLTAVAGLGFKNHGSSQSPARAKGPFQTLAKEVRVPFRSGERLQYEVSWAAFATAASVELSIPEVRDLYGWRTWHFRATAHTVSPVRALFAIDYQFDSYTDMATLESRQYENYLKEMGRTEDQQWRFVVEGQSQRAPGDAVIVLPGTRDPLGALYSLRCNDWRAAPEFRVPVYDGHQLYEMRAQGVPDAESVEVAAGRFIATRVRISIFQNKKEVSDVDFAVWIANDPVRTPVLMRAELPFGTLRIELTSASR